MNPRIDDEDEYDDSEWEPDAFALWREAEGQPEQVRQHRQEAAGLFGPILRQAVRSLHKGPHWHATDARHVLDAVDRNKNAMQAMCRFLRLPLQTLESALHILHDYTGDDWPRHGRLRRMIRTLGSTWGTFDPQLAPRIRHRMPTLDAFLHATGLGSSWESFDHATNLMHAFASAKPLERRAGRSLLCRLIRVVRRERKLLTNNPKADEVLMEMILAEWPETPSPNPAIVLSNGWTATPITAPDQIAREMLASDGLERFADEKQFVGSELFSLQTECDETWHFTLKVEPSLCVWHDIRLEDEPNCQVRFAVFARRNQGPPMRETFRAISELLQQRIEFESEPD